MKNEKHLQAQPMPTNRNFDSVCFSSAAAPQEALDILKSRLDMPIFEIRKPILRLPGDWLIVQHLFLPLPLLMMWN